jgi:hypothetical protein
MFCLLENNCIFKSEALYQMGVFTIYKGANIEAAREVATNVALRPELCACHCSLVAVTFVWV